MGTFDIRNVIGALLGLYGLVLIAAYFFLDPGINVDTGETKEAIYNLWAGIAMLIVAAGFGLWAKFSPISPVPENGEEGE